jgi:hypothetical protein
VDLRVRNGVSARQQLCRFYIPSGQRQPGPDVTVASGKAAASAESVNVLLAVGAHASYPAVLYPALMQSIIPTAAMRLYLWVWKGPPPRHPSTHTSHFFLGNVN